MIWTVLFLTVIVSCAVYWFASWRFARNFALRCIVLTRHDEKVWMSVVVDFVDMLALSRHVLVETEPGSPEWPELHRLRRLDGPRWEAVPETAHWQHRVDWLRASLGRRPAPGLDLAPNAEAEEQKELEALTSNTPIWEEWGWGSQAEAAFQLFLRRYRPPTAANRSFPAGPLAGGRIQPGLDARDDHLVACEREG